MFEPLSLKQFLFPILESYSDRIAFSIYRKGLKSFSYLDIFSLTLEITKLIQKEKLGPKDKIAIILDSSPEYSATFFACGLLGHPAVLIDPKLGVQEITQILNHSDSKLILTGFYAKNVAKEVSEKNNCPIVAIDGVLIPKLTKDFIQGELHSFKGHEYKDTALLVYTSGTTSDPKGVMISLENLLFNGLATISAMGPHQDAVFLSILPLNHLLEFSGGMLTPFRLGSHVIYANTILPHEIIERFGAHKFTDMIVVPLFLRTLMKSLYREINKKKALKIYLWTAMKLSQLIPVPAFRKIIFYPLRKKLGFLKRFVSGGAALDKKTQLFFTLLGIKVSQGYGLTETSPVSTVTYKNDKVLGTQGRPLPGTEVKIDSTGEVLIRGPHVMQGYYKKPDITSQVIDSEGWFRSGDLGYLDKKGNLYITGRLKELIVLGNGKKVFPDEVELSIVFSENIKELIIVGAQSKTGPLKNTEAVCAVVVPSEEMIKSHSGSGQELTMRELIETEIRKHSESLAAYKRPSKIYLSLIDLPKTNTRKSKRMLIKKMIEEGDIA